MFHQKRQGIQTDQIGKDKIGFVKFVEITMKIAAILWFCQYQLTQKTQRVYPARRDPPERQNISGVSRQVGGRRWRSSCGGGSSSSWSTSRSRPSIPQRSNAPCWGGCRRVRSSFWPTYSRICVFKCRVELNNNTGLHPKLYCVNSEIFLRKYSP